jgi:8-oxo-dGTP pyrophosphatase MutT (NUDIX family)
MNDQHNSKTGMVSLKTRQRLAHAFQRMPWIIRGLKAGFRLTRAHFTAGAVGVVFNVEGKFLLVEHVFHPEHPWGLPGGWVERRESPHDTLVRELHEETGLIVRDILPVLIERIEYNKHLNIAFICNAQNDVQALSAELLDYRWVAIDQLPDLGPFHRRAVEAAIRQRKFGNEKLNDSNHITT